MILGVTHSTDGRTVLRLAVSTKVAIGMPPEGDRNYPSKLDHFVFLRKKKTPKGVDWELDPGLMKHYGNACKAFEIMLIDDDIDNVFPTSYAWWTAAERKCWGDGTLATRRTPGRPSGEPWTPCGSQCPELASGLCKPSGDLRFVLADFPRLGSVCRIHTSSYRSIRQIHSALEEIQTFTGGRLAGIAARLAVRPEQISYFDRKEHRRKAATIWALSLEADGDDIGNLVAKLTGNAKLFVETRKLLGWGDRMIEVVEEEEQRAPEITAEFYPATADPATTEESPDGNAAGTQTEPEALCEPTQEFSPPWSDNGKKAAAKPLIMEPRRRTELAQGAAKGGDSSKRTHGSVAGAPQPGGAKRNDQSASCGSHAQAAELHGIVGPFEPDAAGNKIRRTGKGIEYVLFTMAVNGSMAKVYCRQAELLPEIARRRGQKAVAQAEVIMTGARPCYILKGFVEG